MDVATFMASMFKNTTDLVAALGWPVAIAYCAYLFRSDIRAMLGRAKRLAAAGISIELLEAQENDRKISGALEITRSWPTEGSPDATTKPEAPPSEPPATPAGSQARPRWAEALDRAMLLKEPTEVVQAYWGAAEGAARALIAVAMRRPPSSIVDLENEFWELVARDVISPNEAQVFTQLITVRDRVADGRTPILPETVSKYCETVEAFVEAINSRASSQSKAHRQE